MNNKQMLHAILCITQGILLIASVFVLAVLVLGASHAFMKNIVSENNLVEKEAAIDSLKNEIYSEYRVLQITNKKTLSAKEQEAAIKTLIGHVAFIESQQETVLNDLRQESNNIINKVNGWLGFWIAILAIFGGIVPIIIQYVLHKRSQFEIKQVIESINKKACSNHLQLLVSSVCLQNEFGIILDNAQRGDLINLIIADMNSSFEELVNLAENNENTLSREYETSIINALIQYYRAIDALIILERREDRGYRRLFKLHGDIRSLIIKIIDHSNYSRDKIWSALMDLLPKLRTLTHIRQNHL